MGVVVGCLYVCICVLLWQEAHTVSTGGYDSLPTVSRGEWYKYRQVLRVEWYHILKVSTLVSIMRCL